MVKEIQDKLEWMFCDMIFEEERHLYFINGVTYPSVSGLIKKHETFVDFAEKARNQAKRRKVPVSVVTGQWDKKRDDACALGSNTHLYAELYDGTQEPSNLLESAAKKFHDELPEHYVIISRELRMYSREFRYAGTADLILLDTRDNSLVIADYKTNEQLFRSYDNMLAPFDKLEQNNFNKYQLQLSYYQIMLEQSHYNVSKRVIIWLKRDGNYEIFNTKDYTKEIRKHLLDEQFRVNTEIK